MLVNLDAADLRQVECVAARDHGPREIERLALAQALVINRHQQRGNLIVRDRPVNVAADQIFDFPTRQLAAAALFDDELAGVHSASPVSIFIYHNFSIIFTDLKDFFAFAAHKLTENKVWEAELWNLI